MLISLITRHGLWRMRQASPGHDGKSCPQDFSNPLRGPGEKFLAPHSRDSHQASVGGEYNLSVFQSAGLHYSSTSPKGTSVILSVSHAQFEQKRNLIDSCEVKPLSTEGVCGV